jgi:hypothetical protein
MSVAPQQSIILLEDIDAAFVKKDDSVEGSKRENVYMNRVGSVCLSVRFYIVKK